MKKSVFYFIIFLALLAINFNACKEPKENPLPDIIIEVKTVNQTDIVLTVDANKAYKVKMCRDLTYCSEQIVVNSNLVEFTFAGLTSNKVYSFQATAFFNQEEKESEIIEVRTKPAASTLPAQTVGLHEANLLAEIFFDQDINYYFVYGLNSNHLDQKTTTKAGHGVVSEKISNLQWGANYFFKVILEIEGNSFPGEIKSFKTLGSKPELKNFRVVCEDTLNMKLEFDFRGNLLPSTATLRYIQEDHPLVTLNQTFSNTDTVWTTQSFSFPIQAGYQYFTEIKVENNLGINMVDSLINSPAFMYDGFLYHFVRIGNQEWIVENFRGEHYLNGDPIPYILEDTAWITATTGALCYYEHLKENFNDYGCLYNFYVIEDPRGICPPGWRIPTEDDYYEMIYLVLYNEKLREIGYDYWLPPNTGANNETGFSARGAGNRGIHINVGYVGKFADLKKDIHFHVNESFANLSAAFNLSYLNGGSFFYNQKNRGSSIRLVR